MLHKLMILTCFAFVVSLTGCGPDTGPAAPVTESSEMAEYAAENPAPATVEVQSE